ncbi:hypothetical protein KFL_012040030 [Klebsormidium nitens]|uniref:Uncharacterized protein n=1 Tax=Klebsormidium nitens TaxID=105231 RepID=A0A1Y1IQG3_KLENI|nr:hypothetical protein KFL_012040030 [Klebsormidium nitens]|eukprot:GAQ92923.1 hypothetical protein KFL_012040030 [Klebsormidium nitens]
MKNLGAKKAGIDGLKSSYPIRNRGRRCRMQLSKGLNSLLRNGSRSARLQSSSCTAKLTRPFKPKTKADPARLHLLSGGLTRGSPMLPLLKPLRKKILVFVVIVQQALPIPALEAAASLLEVAQSSLAPPHQCPKEKEKDGPCSLVGVIGHYPLKRVTKKRSSLTPLPAVRVSPFHLLRSYPSFCFLPSQDIVVYVTPASRPPVSTGSSAYEGSMTFLLSSDFVDGFPSAALAANAVRAALMARPEYPWMRVYVPAHTTDVRGDFLRITPPLGGWVTYGPEQLVFPLTDSDRFARLDDPPAHIISAINLFYREHDIPATERFTRERVTFDHDEQGNVRFTVTMDKLCPAALVMMRDFRIYPEGFARQESSFTRNPVLSIILNEKRQSASDGFVQVRPRPSAARARLVKLFSAVQFVFDRLLARERARAAAARRGNVPSIVELADAGENLVPQELQSLLCVPTIFNLPFSLVALYLS